MSIKVYPIGSIVKIGYSPEHNARAFRFDISKYLCMWPNTSPKMLVQRNGDISTYIADTQLDGNTIIWTVTRYDTMKVGTGRMWVGFFGKNDEQLGLTPVTQICVEAGAPNINGYTPPETAIPWVQKVLQAADRIENSTGGISDKSVVNANTSDGFPEEGSVNTIYKADQEKQLYQWNPIERKYEKIIFETNVSFDDIMIIHGGNAHGTN